LKEQYVNIGGLRPVSVERLQWSFDVCFRGEISSWNSCGLSQLYGGFLCANTSQHKLFDEVLGKVLTSLSGDSWIFKKLPTETLSSPLDESVTAKIPSAGILVPISCGGLVLRRGVRQLGGGDLEHTRVELKRLYEVLANQ
jgi:hypothetical protein